MNKDFLSKQLFIFLFALFAGVFGPTNVVAQVASWTGNGDGTNYSDPDNWTTNAVPINGASNNYNVIVPDNQDIVFDVAGSISGMSFGVGGKIELLNGVGFVVEGVASIGSEIIADGIGTRFQATGVGVSLEAGVVLTVTNGAEIEVGPTEYTSSNGDAIEAAGTNSLVRLPQTQSITNAGGVSIFRASNQAVVDFPDLTGIDGGSGGNQFVMESGGMINLLSLETLTASNYFQILASDYSLNSLTAVSGGSIFEVADTFVLDLPNLISVSGGSNQFIVGDNSTVEATGLNRLDDTTLSLENNSAFNAGSINSFQNSIVELGASSINVNLGPLTQIDNSQISVVDGATISVGANSFNRSRAGSSTAFRADQPGSMIDASMLETFENQSPIPPNLGNPPYVTTVIAENGGVIDLSMVTLIDGGSLGSFSRTSRNHFIMRTGGMIQLDRLETISQINIFDIEVPRLDLNSLITAGGFTFNLATATELNTPNLVTVQGSNRANVSMPIFSNWNLENVESFQDANLIMDVGAFFNAPLLTDFANSYVELAPGINFQTGPLTQIDNSQFIVSGGFQQLLDATSYSRTRAGSSSIFHVDGTGSLIEAPMMQTIENVSSIPPNVGNPAYITNFIVENNGVLELPAVDSIDGGSRGSFGRTSLNRFTLSSGGLLNLGNVSFTGINQILINAGGTLKTNGISLDVNSTVFATDLGTLEISGNLSHDHTSEASFNLDGGRVVVSDIELAELEIAGEDRGAATDGLANFGFQQLRIGNDNMATKLVLTDRIDNGNRANGNETQYLLEAGGTALDLRNGSTLLLNGFDLYYSDLVSGDLQSARSQFPAGERTIAFADGTISLTADFGEIVNGDFESGSLIGFNTHGTGTVENVASPVPATPGSVLSLDTDSAIEIVQQVSTLGQSYRVEFDAFSQSTGGTVTLLLGGVVIDSWDATEISSVDFEKYSAVINDPALQNQIDIQLVLRWEGTLGDPLYIDNLRVVEVESAQVDVVFGEYVRGVPADVLQSDNLDFVARRAASDFQSRVYFEVANVSGNATPNELTFTFEGSVFARRNVSQTLLLFDYQTDQFVEVDSRPASRFNDQVVNVEITSDVARFVQPGTNQVKARIEFDSSSQRQSFSAFLDQVSWSFQ